jgi:OPA family glycerol-3-phosphate transporter-like MFS transporter
MIKNIIFLGILVTITVIYALNNPMKHSTAFRIRSWLNWFPMGLTYAFLYMARYNLTVSKNALGEALMAKEDFGIIFAAGTITYAFSFLVNGPLVDRIGGKRGILIGATGAAIMNVAMGILTWLILTKRASLNLTVAFSVLYAMNMYFQSYGAVSIVKLNAHWFHVKERGVFSGIFGTLISLGIYFAFDWGQAIVNATRLSPSKDLGLFESLLSRLLGTAGAGMDQTWYVFYIPAAILLLFVALELFLLRDRPSQAGHEDFDTGDASSGDMDTHYGTLQIIKKILTNPIILTIAAIEFCSGVIRNGIMHWYFIFAKEIGMTGATLFFKENWGLLLCFAGIFGGFFAGTVSDKLFQSRRGPSAAFMYGGMLAGTIVMTFVLRASPLALGIVVVFISLCVIGVHGLLSGTATMDFGGRKGAATAVGMIDGFVYLGTGVQSLSLGFITSWNWNFWPVFLIPFAVLGTGLAVRIWRAFPDARRRGT